MPIRLLPLPFCSFLATVFWSRTTSPAPGLWPYLMEELVLELFQLVKVWATVLFLPAAIVTLAAV